MLELGDLKQTRIYQEIREEISEEIRELAKLEIGNLLLERGFKIEDIAVILNIELDKLRRSLEKPSQN